MTADERREFRRESLLIDLIVVAAVVAFALGWSGCSLDGSGLSDFAVAGDATTGIDGAHEKADAFTVDQGAGGAGGASLDGGAGGVLDGNTDQLQDGNTGDQVVAIDAACLGCWDGSICVLPAQQTEDRCGHVGEPCGRTFLVCGGMGRGSCADGEELGGRHACNEPSGQVILRPICCPVNVCTYEACR